MILSVIGGFFSFGLAWANGANDTANSFGVVVGSKTLKIRTSIITCAIFEFFGAVLTGSAVAKTISKGIVNSDLFDSHPRGPELFAAMALAVLIGTFSWTLLATWLKLPVSITHGVVGSLIAAGLLALGPNAIVFKKVLLVCISWVTSPICGGIAAAILWLATKKLCHSQTPEVSHKRIEKFIPLYFFITFAILAFFIITKGPPELKAALKGNDLILGILPVGVGLIGALIGKPLSIYFADKSQPKQAATSEPLAKTNRSSSMVNELSSPVSLQPNVTNEVQIHVPPSSGDSSHQTAGTTVDEANVTKGDEGVVDVDEGKKKNRNRC